MKTRILTLAVLTLALAACSKSDPETPADGNSVAATFNAEITPATRVNTEGTDWSEGDRVGITGAGYTNIPYVVNNGKFAANGTIIYFQSTETETFNAYYPYQTDGGVVAVTTDAAHQGTGIDFLFASGATGSTSNPEVSFTGDHAFKHCMSLIKLIFKAGDGITFADLKPASYTIGGLKLEGTFDTATGTTAVTASAAAPITMQLDGATQSQVIIFPQEVTADPDLTVTFNSQSYKATLQKPTKPAAGFYSAGYAYTYTVTINNTGITVEAAGIAPWEGGDSNDVSVEL